MAHGQLVFVLLVSLIFRSVLASKFNSDSVNVTDSLASCNALTVTEESYPVVASNHSLQCYDDVIIDDVCYRDDKEAYLNAQLEFPVFGETVDDVDAGTDIFLIVCDQTILMKNNRQPAPKTIAVQVLPECDVTCKLRMNDDVIQRIFDSDREQIQGKNYPLAIVYDQCYFVSKPKPEMNRLSGPLPQNILLYKRNRKLSIDNHSTVKQTKNRHNNSLISGQCDDDVIIQNYDLHFVPIIDDEAAFCPKQLPRNQTRDVTEKNGKIRALPENTQQNRDVEASDDVSSCKIDTLKQERTICP